MGNQIPFGKILAIIGLAAVEAGRPKTEYAPGSMEYQALHPDWKPQEESY